jgi:hypothetical protein
MIRGRCRRAAPALLPGLGGFDAAAAALPGLPPPADWAAARVRLGGFWDSLGHCLEERESGWHADRYALRPRPQCLPFVSVIVRACVRACTPLPGAAAVLAGAYGSHAFREGKSAYFKGIFDTANRYHLLHSALAPAASAQPHLVRATRHSAAAALAASRAHASV